MSVIPNIGCPTFGAVSPQQSIGCPIFATVSSWLRWVVASRLLALAAILLVSANAQNPTLVISVPNPPNTPATPAKHYVVLVSLDEMASLVYNEFMALLDPRFSVYRCAEVPAALHYDGNPREGDPVIVPLLFWSVIPEGNLRFATSSANGPSLDKPALRPLPQ